MRMQSRLLLAAAFMLFATLPLAAVTDLFPAKVTVTHATGFNVSYHGTWKEVTIKHPWRDAARPLTYILVQQGTPVPAKQGDAVVTIPIKTCAVLSSTYLPHLDLLGKAASVVGIDNIKHVNTPSIRDRIAAGHVREIGSTVTMNIERIVALAPDVLFSYTLDNAEAARRRVLTRAGVPLILGSSYLETTPLGRAEWLKFTALFFNAERQAEAEFVRVRQEYEALVDLVTNQAQRPTVLSNAPYKGIWHVPGGRSYTATLMRDAGADYLWASDTHTGGVPVAVETVVNKAVSADFWINPSGWRSLAEGLQQDPRFTLFRAFRDGRVYNNNKRLNAQGGNDFWESGVINPHIVLKDLIHIFHRDTLPHHVLYYFQQLK
jgi:iron complex transport system substrate-binding protein